MYEFKHAGKTFKITSFADLPVGVIRKARKGKDDADIAFTIIEGITGENSAELQAIDSMTKDEFNSFIEGWTQGAGVGEA